jgi:hypothetical protein
MHSLIDVLLKGPKQLQSEGHIIFLFFKKNGRYTKILSKKRRLNVQEGLSALHSLFWTPNVVVFLS